VWIWAGFAMVMIASGLSAMDISLQEAARVDGANEWQVFRRITAPLLAPVLIVVFIIGDNFPAHSQLDRASFDPGVPGKRYDLVGDGRSTQQPTLQKAFH